MSFGACVYKHTGVLIHDVWINDVVLHRRCVVGGDTDALIPFRWVSCGWRRKNFQRVRQKSHREHASDHRLHQHLHKAA
jgi:hypothetical protein